jgi:hypothetical protein
MLKWGGVHLKTWLQDGVAHFSHVGGGAVLAEQGVVTPLYSSISDVFELVNMSILPTLGCEHLYQ